MLATLADSTSSRNCSGLRASRHGSAMPEIGYYRGPRLLPRHVNDAEARQGAGSICLKLNNAVLVKCSSCAGTFDQKPYL
jgi:hypothetical protein